MNKSATNPQPLYLSARRGCGRARDLAGHALRLCQPRADPLRADEGRRARPPLPRRGCAQPQEPARAAGRRAGAQGGRSAGAGFLRLNDHRRRSRLSRRAGDDAVRKRDVRTGRNAFMGRAHVRSIRERQSAAYLAADARHSRGYGACGAHRSRDCGSFVGDGRRSCRVQCDAGRPRHHRCKDPAAGRSRDAADAAERRADPRTDRAGLGARPSARQRSHPPRAGASRRSRTECIDLHRALRGVDGYLALRLRDRRSRRAERAAPWRRGAAGFPSARDASGRRCSHHHPRARGIGRTLCGLRPHGLWRPRSARAVHIRSAREDWHRRAADDRISPSYLRSDGPVPQLRLCARRDAPRTEHAAKDARRRSSPWRARPDGSPMRASNWRAKSLSARGRVTWDRRRRASDRRPSRVRRGLPARATSRPDSPRVFRRPISGSSCGRDRRAVPAHLVRRLS